MWDCSSTLSSTGAGGAGAGVGAGASVVSAISSLSSDSEIKEAEAVSDFVGWMRSCDIF